MMNAENDYLTVSQPRDYAAAFEEKGDWTQAAAGGYFTGEVGRHDAVRIDGNRFEASGGYFSNPGLGWQDAFNLGDTQKPLLAWYLDQVQAHARATRGSGRLRTWTRQAGSWHALVRPDYPFEQEGPSHRIERREVSIDVGA